MSEAYWNIVLGACFCGIHRGCAAAQLDIRAVTIAVYLRHLINVLVSVQWMWSTSKSAFIRSCKNPTISFLQTAAFQLK